MIDLAGIAQIATVLVIGAGYWFLYRSNVHMFREMRGQRDAVGRPQVIVTDNYGDLPHVSIVVRNVSGGSARDIEFDFSVPIQSSDGFVISDLPYLRDGMDFLAPDGEITCYWDHLDRLLPSLREQGIEDGISITTRYKDLTGESYMTRWTINPFLYEGSRFYDRKGAGDIVASLDRISNTIERTLSEGREARPGSEGRERESR